METHRPFISVIVPVFNVQEYLEPCLSSIRNQTYQHIQIILVDDGSTDESAGICDRHQAEDSRITVIHKKNGGLVSARKAGLERVDGQYVTFVDGDDWIDENTLEQIIPYLAGGKGVDLVAYGCIEEYKNRQINRYNRITEGTYTGETLENIKDRMLMGSVFFEWNILPHLCDKVVRTSFLKECMGHVSERTSFGEDAACTFPCIEKSRSMVSLNIAPYHYRQREGSIVKSTGELDRAGFSGLYKTLSNAFAGREMLLAQLKYYLFFVLLLKGYSGIESNMILFPFEKVRPGSRVYVYGAGGFGKVVKTWIEGSEGLELAGWSDGNAELYRNLDQNVQSIDAIMNTEFDILVIAILNEGIAKQVKETLTKRGIEEARMDSVQKEVLDSQTLPSWLI